MDTPLTSHIARWLGLASEPERLFLSTLGLDPSAVPIFIGAIFLVAVADILARSRRRDLLVLGLIVGLGVVLRMIFSRPTLLDHQNYYRVPEIIDWLAERNLPIYALFPDGLDRMGVILRLDLVLSCALPFLLYCWAEAAFGIRRVSLLAAFFTAVCPINIYFGYSETQFISSNAATAVTFLLLHLALTERALFLEILYGVASLLSFSLTLHARQGNFLFAGVALVAAFPIVFGHGPRRWLKPIWSVVMLIMALAAVLSVTQGSTGFDAATRSFVGEDLDTYVEIKTLLYTNNYFRPSFYPFAVTMLACLGLVRLARSDRWTLLYLVSYFGAFYLLLAVIDTWDINHAGRFALQSLVPVAFAAAFGMDWLLSKFAAWRPSPGWLRPAAASAAVVVALATVPPSLALFRQGDADVQEEYDFLRELARMGIPEPGALVIEPYNPPDEANVNCPGPDIVNVLDEFWANRGMLRFEFLGQTVEGTGLVPTIASAESLRPHDGPVYRYEGMPCFWLRLPAEPISRFCAAARREGEWEVVARRRIYGHLHDRTNGTASPGAEIALYRLVRPPNARAADGEPSP